MKLSSDKLPLWIARVLPYACIAAVGITLVASIALGWTDLAIKGLYLAIPVVLASVLIIWKPGLLQNNLSSADVKVNLGIISFTHLVLLFSVLYVISLCLLVAVESRPLMYFILMALMASLIFLEILVMDSEKSFQKNIILLQISLLLANSIFGQTLKLPLYYCSGGGDVLLHMRLIRSILEKGHISDYMGMYENFPLFHILGASATLMTGIDIPISYYITMGLSFSISILIVYLLITLVVKNGRTPLIAALFYSLSSVVIFEGTYIVVRVLAFILCFLVLYLLIKGSNNIKLKALAIFFVIPLTLMHQTTLVYFSAILLIFILIELIMYHRSHYIGYGYPIFFTIAYLAYWLYIAHDFFTFIINTITSTDESVVIPQLTLSEPILVSIFKEFDSVIIAFFAIIGIVALFKKSKLGIDITKVFAVLALIALLFYFKGPASFLEPLFLASRLRFPSAFFIVFAAAIGISIFANQTIIRHYGQQSFKSFATIACCATIFLLSLSSNVILGNQTDFPNSKLFGLQNSGYFTESELGAFSFYNEYRYKGTDYSDYEAWVHLGRVPSYTQANIYTDYGAWRYLGGYLDGVPSITTTDVFDSKSIQSGYMLLRSHELEFRGQLIFLTGVKQGFSGTPYYYRYGDFPDIKTTWESEQKIFDCGSVQIYLKRYV